MWESKARLQAGQACGWWLAALLSLLSACAPQTTLSVTELQAGSAAHSGVPGPLNSGLTPRRAFSAAWLDGQVYAVGGWNGQATQLNVVEALDPATMRWLPAPPLTVARSQHVTLSADNALWVLGGWS